MGMPDLFVARVIYSEASPICKYYERSLVASVIKNRICHNGFGCGKLKTMKDVVGQANAFSCVDDDNNENWAVSGKFDGSLDGANRYWKQCLLLSCGDFPAYPGIVYYHDKTIKKPSCWDNKWWTAIFELDTANFVFYSVREC